MTDKPILTEATEKLVRAHFEQHGGSLTESLSLLVSKGKQAIDNPPPKRAALVKPGVQSQARESARQKDPNSKGFSSADPYSLTVDELRQEVIILNQCCDGYTRTIDDLAAKVRRLEEFADVVCPEPTPREKANAEV